MRGHERIKMLLCQEDADNEEKGPVEKREAMTQLKTATRHICGKPTIVAVSQTVSQDRR